MTDNALFIDPLDNLNDNDLAQENRAFDFVDKMVDRAISTKDINIVVAEVARLKRGARIVGMSLVRLLGRISENWEVFGINEPMQDFLLAETGLLSVTIDRYIRVYEMLKQAHPDIRPKLEDMNVKNLIPLGNMVRQGWELERKDWEDVADASDYGEVAEITRRLKGQEPRKSGLRLWVNRQGEIFAFKKLDENTEERRYICTIEINSPDPITKQAVERLLTGAGVLLQ